MDFLDLAKKRRTTFEFSEKTVSPTHVAKILEAARWAPSCTNTQPWHFIVISDGERINKLMDAVNYGFFHTNPPMIIAAVLEAKRCAGKNHACFIGKDSGLHDTYMSVGIAVQNMALEAAELGVDSAILTPDQSKVRDLLKIPKDDVVPLFLALGYEKEKTYNRKRERRALKDMVSYEYFGGKAK